jgi:hypothetical protein
MKCHTWTLRIEVHEVLASGVDYCITIMMPQHPGNPFGDWIKHGRGKEEKASLRRAAQLRLPAA